MPESARGRAWAKDPERVDPDERPPGEPFAAYMTSAPCERCSLEVHILLKQFVLSGLECPRCAAQLAAPPGAAASLLQWLMREEDALAERIQCA